MKECKNGYSNSQRKDIYIEHRAGKAPCQASWRKMTQLGELLVMVALEGVPGCAHLPRKETL